MYYNGYIRLYTVTVATLFLLSPLLALPYILLGIYRQERSAYFFFALFLGFLAWLQFHCPTCSGIHSIFITI